VTVSSQHRQVMVWVGSPSAGAEARAFTVSVEASRDQRLVGPRRVGLGRAFPLLGEVGDSEPLSSIWGVPRTDGEVQGEPAVLMLHPPEDPSCCAS
jgi:hypothetical protein